MNLKEAREKGKLKEFIKEHEKDAPGDKERLDKTIDRLVREEKSKEAPEISDRDSSGC